MSIDELCPTPCASPSPVSASSAVLTIPSSPSADGSAPKTSKRETGYWKRLRPCEWCGALFAPKYVQEAKKRFCGKSCSAKWRMRQPAMLARVHAPEVAAKRGAKRSAWLRSGDPRALAELDRIRKLNSSTLPEVREKISRTLKLMHHGPSVRGGNGRGLTEPQRLLMAALGPNWVAEWPISLGPRMAGYPTHYKLDLALVERRVGIEVDGFSHASRRALDTKKDEMLASLGWTVLRFSNQTILTWITAGMPPDSSVSMILAVHAIRLFPSGGC